jgi:hypothetical protein
MKTLGGSTFVWNGVKQDYNFIETLECLYRMCDEIAIVHGGDDGTNEKVTEWFSSFVNRDGYTIGGHDNLVTAHRIGGKMIYLYQINESDWKAQQGREKLSYFSNIAISHLQTDWNFYLQCDEILHEDSYPYVRAAIEEEQADGYLVRRLNLWRDPYHMLNVPQERKPVSTEVLRLARTRYRCVDDAESIGCNDNVGIFGDIDTIQIFHLGFVRDKVKHLEKIKHMQLEVFLWGDYDEKAKNCTEFQADRWFDPEKDLVIIPKPLPKLIQQWAADRYPDITPVSQSNSPGCG